MQSFVFDTLQQMPALRFKFSVITCSSDVEDIEKHMPGLLQVLALIYLTIQICHRLFSLF